MPRTRKTHPPTLKANVAVEAIKGQRTSAEIAQMFSVHPNLVANWKKQALELLPEIFTPQTGGPSKPDTDPEKEELYKQIGRMKATGLSQKKNRNVRLRTNGDGSIPSIHS